MDAPSGALTDVAERYRLLVEHSPDTIVVHAAGRLVYVNPAGVRLLGAGSEGEIVGRPISDFLHPDSCGPLQARIDSLDSEGSVSCPTEMVVLRLDGRPVDVEAVGVRTRWAGLSAYQVVIRDLTAQKRAEAALRRAEEHFKTVVSSLNEGVVVISRTGRIESANPAARRLLHIGRPADGSFISAFDVPLFDTDGNPIPRNNHPVRQVLRSGASLGGFIYGVEQTDGTRAWFAGSSRLLNPNDPDSAVVASFTDVTAQRAIRARLEFEANHDSLTALPNRAHMVAGLRDFVASATPGERIAVLFIDLDDFKVINDSLGHSVGDVVLKLTATRLRQALGPGDLVGRLGGDEFVAVLPGNLSGYEVDHLVDRLHEAVSEPIELDGRTLRVDASIGISTVDAADPRTAEDVLRDADLAMYEAKMAGRGRSRYFTVDLRDRMRRRLEAGQALFGATTH
ncbi:diguanylate cyclase domain-containing protein [Antrihabitans sp. YC2-6]|uniref:diguanylate cyclase domain-containing protein n=1 Tax=Antrihabitans sp. YC2-6 TaxID=2799498 RepID=UPI001F3623F7|nr:diguanylate cyclase [Antrihabitans sp. YC2-6]